MIQFEHIEAENFSGFASIEVTDILGFVHLAEANNQKFIFRSGAKDKQSAPEEFYFPVTQLIFKIKAQGYILVEDFYSATVKKFPGASEYYEARKSGFDSYEEFKHSKDAGSNGSRESFEIAKAAGFVKGYEVFLKKYNTYKLYKHTASIDDCIDNPVKLFEYAQRKNFKTYSEFEKAHDAGYPDSAIYSEAFAKGFKSADDFFEAVQKGFSLPTELDEAKRMMIASKKELDDYRYLKAGNFRAIAFDEHHLLMLLREYENGSKFTLTELRNLLTIEQEKYKRGFSGNDLKVLPVWYSQKIQTEEKLLVFMTKDAEIKNFGTYDAANATYEIFRLNKTKVYVDASNVAHNSGGKDKSVPFFKNLRLIVEELKHWKFRDIIVIADASLRHKAKDTNELERIKKLAEYHESPSHTSADKFLLELIHREKCIIISNDTFSDWQRKDYWVKKNIDKLRVPFFIKDNHVILTGIEHHAKLNED